MQNTGTGLVLLCFFAVTFSALADDAVQSVKLEAELPTLHCLGYRWFISGDDNGNAAVDVSYREAGAGDWREAMPLRRVEVAAMEERKPPDDQGLFAGSIFFLQPDTEYEVKLELSDPDGGGATEVVKQRTWKEPIAPKPLRVLHVVPGSGGGSGSETDPFMGIASADGAAMPGDLMLVHAGIYKGIVSFTKSGTPESPIVWRGAGDGAAIIEGAKGGPKKGENDIAVTMYGVRHVFFENLSFHDAHWTFHASGSSYITVRRCHFKNVGYGYFATGKQERVFICDNLIEGVEAWPRDKEARKFENRGIDISGTGHVICFNTIRNFGDGVDVRPNYPIRAIDIHNNDISECVDDAIELDFSEQNVRAYCNRITNVSMGISFQPCRGGPAYAVRNVLYNVGHETWKLHLTPVNPKSSWATGPHRTSGGVMIHNTIVKSTPPFRVYSQEGPVNNFYMRNNLYVGTGANAIEVVPPLNDFDSDYNAYASGDGKPWRAFAWVFRKTYKTIEDYAALAGQEKHGISLTGYSGIFAEDVEVPDRATKYLPPDLNLAPNSHVIDKGEVLGSINDGYTGENPDIGAYEFGVKIPHYGIRPTVEKSGQRSMDMMGRIRFFVDPKTNSDDSERRMAYGINVAPPWTDGGALFINLPEHLEYMSGTRGIARHHDKRENVWQVSADGSEAWYDVESLTEPGVFFSAKVRSEGERADFEMTITNKSRITLKSIRPLLCYQYHSLKGFPTYEAGNFAHTFIVINGKPVALKDLKVERPEAKARMAQVRGCPDEHNWWAEKMGGFIEERMDMAFTVLIASEGDRKVVIFWTPGKNLLTNSAIPCIHADPYFGDLAPGESRSANGVLIFTEAPLNELIEEFAAKAEQPWESGK